MEQLQNFIVKYKTKKAKLLEAISPLKDNKKAIGELAISDGLIVKVTVTYFNLVIL